MAEQERGQLRIYLGAAAGAGKTFDMLGEGHRRAERGADVVVAFVETHGRQHTAALLDGLEIVPRARIAYRGTMFEDMDLDAVLARKPQIALVDEFAHTNVPGSRHAKRWEDVEELLAAGIDVISNVNIQHLESLNDVVQKITGVPQRETVPDAMVRAADQVELVDITPEALRRRMAHGNIYPPEKIDAALTNYFRTGNLTALRELALLWLADKVDEGLQRYRAEHGIRGTWEARERVVVALTGGQEGETLIRRGARIAARSTGGDLLAVHVTRSDGLTGADPAALAEQRRLTESLGGTYHQVVGDDIPEALLSFARAENATQLVLGASRRSWLSALLTGPGFGARTIRGSGDIDVHIVTHAHMGRGRGLLPRSRGGLTLRRRRGRLRAGGRPLPAADPAAGQPARPAQPDQRRARLPGRGHRGRPGRRVRARHPGRGGRVAAAQLLLHPAAAQVHHRRGQQRAGPHRVRGRRADRQLGGGHRGPADPAGGPGQRRIGAAGHHGGQRAARPAGRGGRARPGPRVVRHGLGHAAGVRAQPWHGSPRPDDRVARRGAVRRAARGPAVRRGRGGAGRRDPVAGAARPLAARGGPPGAGRVRGLRRGGAGAAAARRGGRGRPAHRRGGPDAHRAARGGQPRPAHPAGLGQGRRDQPALGGGAVGPGRSRRAAGHRGRVARPAGPPGGQPARHEPAAGRRDVGVPPPGRAGRDRRPGPR